MSQVFRPLTRRFYRRDPESLARALLGRCLVRRVGAEVLVGRIVEVEAYLGKSDCASHSFGGRHTPRNHSMYLEGGHAYVYFIYGMHHCFNVVSDREGVPTACLIRAVEPLKGVDLMRRHRLSQSKIKNLKDTDLCSGPAKLAAAFQIDRALDGSDLTENKALAIVGDRSVAEQKITALPRIGVDYAGPWALQPLRFCVSNSKYLSVKI